jgi:flagellum-specific ATP synthase
LFTTLVEQDDMNDPIADAVRSILDGHIVLTRELATQNHYPAIEVLDSVSRLSRDLCSADQIEVVGHAREALALFRRNQDLINIGAYPAGSNGAIDHAIRLHEPLKKFLRQGVREGFGGADSWRMLGEVMALQPNATARSVLSK